MKVTVYKEMYSYSQIVEYNGRFGRVIYHDSRTHLVHVMFRINNNTWKIERYDELHCKPAQVFLWTIENAFNTKYLRKTRTPQFEPIRVSYDYIMEL